MKTALVALVMALVVAPAMGGNMGPEEKPEWAVGPDGDTSKTIKSGPVPKTLKEATSYLYFDDMPSVNSAALGKKIRPAHPGLGAAAKESVKKPELKVPQQKEEAVHQEAKPTTETVVEPPVLSELGERMHNMIVMHKHTAILGGAVLGLVAFVAVLRTKAVARRLAQATESGTHAEFTPLLRTRREEVYGALRV